MVALPQPVLVASVKKTVFAGVYALPWALNQPTQYFWTLFTSPRMRQSCRSFASAPVWQLVPSDCDGVCCACVIPSSEP